MNKSNSVSFSLGLKLTISVCGFTFISIVMMWSALLYNNYRDEVRSIDTTILEIKNGNLPALTSAVWDLSSSGIENSLNAIRTKPNILCAEMAVEEEQLPCERREDVFRIVDFSLEHPVGGTIGVLRVSFSATDIRQNALGDTVGFLLILIPIGVMAVGIILLFRIMVTSPLIAIARYTERISMENMDEDFSCPGRRKRRIRDEIDCLLDSVNKMRANIREESDSRKLAEGRYRHLFNSTSDALFILDSDGLILEINRQVCSLYRCERKNVIGLHISEFSSVNYSVIMSGMKDVVKAAEEKGAKVFELKTQDMAGQVFWVEAALNASTIDGEKIIIISVRDISARKKAEKALGDMSKYLASIVDSMPSMIVGVDCNGNISQWNRQAVFITGLSLPHVIGQPFDSVMKKIGLGKEQLLEAVQFHKQDVLTLRDWSPSGEKRHLDITVYPLTFDMPDAEQGSVVRIDDVSDRVRMEEMVMQSEKMVSIGGLAAGMAHEINNPLGGIIQTVSVMNDRLSGGNDVFANKKAAEEVGISIDDIGKYMEKRGIFRMLEMIRESGSRISEIVSNMLNFARKGDDFKSTCYISELMDKTIELAASDYSLKKEYDFRQIKIEKDYGEDIPPVFCEHNRIQQVILNILQNGAFAMSDSGTESPRFTIRISYEPGTEMVCIEIGDNGPGMDKSVSARIFEPFFTTKPVGIGTGLGLSIAYFIITENHGGKISVDSRHGEGSVFRISIPVNYERSTV